MIQNYRIGYGHGRWRDDIAKPDVDLHSDAGVSLSAREGGADAFVVGILGHPNCGDAGRVENKPIIMNRLRAHLGHQDANRLQIVAGAPQQVDVARETCSRGHVFANASSPQVWPRSLLLQCGGEPPRRRRRAYLPPVILDDRLAFAVP